MTKNTSKNIKKFECEKCDYSCSKKGDWNRHLLTRKHQNGNKMVTKKPQKTP